MNYIIWLAGPDKMYDVHVHSARPPTYGKNVADKYGYQVGDAWFEGSSVVAVIPASANPQARR